MLSGHVLRPLQVSQEILLNRGRLMELTVCIDQVSPTMLN